MTPEQAFDRYHHAVYGFAWRLTRRADLAEDIAQECFLAYIRRGVDPARGSAKTYLFAIARNLALKHYRDTRPEEPLEETAAERFSPDLAAAVEEAVGGLPALQQEAVVLFEYEGFTLDEIAQVTGADAGTIKSRLHRARERLKRVLAPYRGARDQWGPRGPVSPVPPDREAPTPGAGEGSASGMSAVQAGADQGGPHLDRKVLNGTVE